MTATKDDIRSWLERGQKSGATHVIIKCDTFDMDDGDCCYPVYVEEGEDPREISQENADRTMECYSLALDIEEQLNSFRANNWS